MKKIFASLGAVALGATAVHANSAAGMAMGGDNSKPWSVSATLRGFYDDNYTTAPDGPTKRDSIGITVSPSIAFKFPLDQTTLGFRYIYGATWYEDRTSIDSGNNAWDQTHQFDALFSHSFNSRFSVDASDSFVISQEPELLDSTGVVTVPYRTEGNNIRNHGEIAVNGGLTKHLNFVLGYQNTYYNYENSGFAVNGPTAVTGPGSLSSVDSSLSGLLDRMEHEALFNLRWQAMPKTVLIAGYNYKQVDYLSNEQIANIQTLTEFIPNSGIFVPSGTDTEVLVNSKTRNSRSHIFYGGVDQNFTKDLVLTIRAGVELVDKYNAVIMNQAYNADPIANPNPYKRDPNSSTTSPWGNLSLTYTYLPGSSVQVGFTHSRNQTDVVTPDSSTGSITSDQETSVIYGSIYHRFTPKLSGRLTAQWQDAEFFGGFYDGLSEIFFDTGVNFTYRFTPHFSSEVGYNYSQLNSDASNRDYTRNRVYLGVTASY